MMGPEFTEVLFSLLVSYVGAMELVFVVRSLYHWINQHQQLLNGAPENETLEQMQERIKAAIDEAKSHEFGDYKAMVDGVLYKDGFRVDPDTVAKEKEKQIAQVNRRVIGSSRDSIDDERQEVQEEPCVKKVITRNEGQRISKDPSPMPNRIPSDSNGDVAPQPTPDESVQQPSEPLPQANPPSIRFDEYERQAPDGEDHVPADQFSDEYLRSLDGIKHRRLVRDDGTGRRRSFKKRRSSDESISSIDSRKSREEEVQMFTSLEEEEFENMKRADSDYVPIRYTSDASLKVSKPQKRHNKSPIKDMTKKGDSKESGEDEADYDPWGEVKPEHYKDTQFWKREKNISIEEEQDEDEIIARMKSAAVELASSSKAAVEPTTTRRRVPKESSFEEATSAQNHEAIESLQKIGSKSSETKRSEETSQTKNVSNPNKHDSLESFMAAERNASFDTTQFTENACGEITPTIGTNDQRDDQPKIVDSEADFTQDDMRDQHDTEAAFETISDTNEHQSENEDRDLGHKQGDKTGLDQPTGFYESTTSTMETDRSPVSHVSDYFDDVNKNDVHEDGSLTVSEQGYSNEDPTNSDEPITNPTSEITKSVPTIQIAQSSFDRDDEMEFEEPILQGLSDFYDFNASINPPRSRSTSRSRSRSRSKTRGLPPIHPSRSRSRSRSPSPVPKPKPLNFDDMEGVSDFLDFSVNLNRQSYDPLNVFLYRNISQTSDDFLLEQMRQMEPKGATKKNFDLKLTINNNPPNRRPGSPSLLSPTSTPITPPSSSSSRRRSSVFEREIEYIRQHQRTALEQEGYENEFPDNYDDYDELSENAYRFLRSRSQSRSISDIFDMESEEAAGGSGLQEKILAEIAKTTINYQGLSKELNAAFNDNEQIVEDSMMIAQPEIVIQIDTNRRRYSCDDEEFLRNLEGEEYHHYRRYSLRQDYIEEEYPDDNEDYVYLQRIRHENRSKSLSPSVRSDYTESSDLPDDDKSLISTESELEHADDADESGSEDERQTVVGADDDIGGDVWNGARISENENYIQPDDEIPGDIKYENGNLNEGDWKGQGAVGGAETVVSYNSETSLQIEEIYNEVVENLEQSQIETDYDNLFNQVKDEVVSRNGDTDSIKNDDLLEEILNEPNDVSAATSSSSSRFLDHERLSVSNRKSPFGCRRSPLSRTTKFGEKERSPSLKRTSPSTENEVFLENEQSASDGSNVAFERSPSALGQGAFLDNERSPSASRTTSDHSAFLRHEQSPSETRNTLMQDTFLVNDPTADRKSPRQIAVLANDRSPSADRTSPNQIAFVENHRSPSPTRALLGQTAFVETERSPSATRTAFGKDALLENERSPSTTRTFSSQAPFLDNERTPSASRALLGRTAFVENERSPSATRTVFVKDARLENERNPSTSRTALGQEAFLENERNPSISRGRTAFLENEGSPLGTRAFFENERSPSTSSNFSGQARFLENERSPSTSRTSLSQTNFLDSEPSGTTRTRLRTRYGITTTTSFSPASYDYNESTIATNEITYEPKREYNWRKNFKLDDDDSTDGTSNIPTVVTELTDADEDNDKEVEDTLRVDPDSLDARKFSLGGESITLYSRTPDRLNDFLPDSEQSRKLDDLEENDSFDQDEPLPSVQKEETSKAAADIRKEKKKKKGRRASLGCSESVTEVSTFDSGKREAKELSEETPKKKSSSKTKRRKSTSTVGDESQPGAVGSPKRKSPKRNSPESSKTSQRAQVSEIIKSNQIGESDHTLPNPISPTRTKSDTIAEAPHPVASSFTTESSPVADKSRVNPPMVPDSPVESLESESSCSQASASTSSTSKESSTSTRNRPPLERKESTGAYELIKDGSMYPWF